MKIFTCSTVFLVLATATSAYSATYRCDVSLTWVSDLSDGSSDGKTIGSFDFDTSQSKPAAMGVDAKYHVFCNHMMMTKKVLVCGVAEGHVETEDAKLVAGAAADEGSGLFIIATVPDESLATRAKDVMIDCKLKAPEASLK